MGTFAIDWLNLREPVDHRSVNAVVRKSFTHAVAHHDVLKIVDLGSGTGSNMRGLSPWMAQHQTWTLVDFDQSLLDAAAAQPRLLNVAVETHRSDLATADIQDIVAGADVVTAAAFFDIASRDLVDRIVSATAATGAIFYTVLTYDGVAAWLPQDPADADMRLAFNAHQTRDKGLGAALGPDATDALDAAFSQRGYSVTTGPSPWVVETEHAEMRAMLDSGWADAVAETGTVSADDIARWRHGRLDPKTPDDRVSLIGHRDLLAVPPR